MGIGIIWPEPDAEVCTFTFSSLLGPKPASCISFLAAARSYLMSNLGLPHQGWPGGTVPLGTSIKPPNSCFRSSRLTHRLAAWRTRLSSHGEPSTKENCHGHTCGCPLE